MRRLILLIVLIPMIAMATDKKGPPDNRPPDKYGEATSESVSTSSSESYSSADSYSTSEATASVSGVTGGAGGAAAATNEGNSLSVNSNYESGPADLILVPNNNTESCVRVIGFAFGNSEGSGMLGWPYRSRSCDFEQAADDAFAAGEREWGWFWKCHNRSLARQFRDKGESWEEAIHQCHATAVGHVTALDTIERLNSQVETLMQEREIDRENHKASIERLTQNCETAKDRIVEGCRSAK